MKPSSPVPSHLNVAAVAALAFITACVAHEILGHGGACLAENGRITLLTSVYFRCENGGVIADLAGPAANLLFGAAACLLLEKRTWSPCLRLALVLAAAFNLFWFAGCLLESAVANKSDFAYFLQVLAVSPRWLGQASLGAIGLLAYWFGMRTTSKHVDQSAPLVISYVSAGVVSCGAALFFVGEVAPAVREAALESFGSAIGLVLLAWGARRAPPGSPSIPAPTGYAWLVAGALGTIAFVLLLGRGLVVPGNA